MDNIKNRVLVSFDDICPYQCKHCYTLDIPRQNDNRSIDGIVNAISSTSFDVVYISQRRDNFVIPDKGIELCEKLFERYVCNLFIITRNIFKEQHINRLNDLRKRMQLEGKTLFVAVSIFATKSAYKSENPALVPSPDQRILFLEELSKKGFNTITLIRPVFPSKMVAVEELFEIVDKIKVFDTCIVSSGLAVNENILWRLNMDPSEYKYIDNANYLEGAMEGTFKFLDVSTELNLLKNYCNKNGVPFFEHTIPALNFIVNKNT